MKPCILFLLFFFVTNLWAAKPNVIIVLADDLGWGDPQCYQASSKIPTPAMNRLAEEGLRFTDAHTPSSVCSPTRYGLLTGRYAWRTRLKNGVLDGFDPPLIEPGEDTLATMLKRAGYNTHVVGKWHLGLQWTAKDGSPISIRDVGDGFRQGLEVDFSKPFSGGPLERGFDSYYGISASLDMSPYVFLRNDRVVELPSITTEDNRDGMFMNQVPGLTSLTFDLHDVLPNIGKEVVKLIRGSANDPTPFFCYVPLNSPHLPVVPTEDMIGKSKAGPYGDFVAGTDRVLGDILKALDETNQTEDTFILFTSDNGGLFHYWDFRADDDGGAAPKTNRGEQNRKYGQQSNAHWRGTKADIYEGGHRVPFLIRWPGKATSGMTIDATVELTDVFATISEIVGESARGTSGMDSVSLLPIIENKQKTTRPFSIHHSARGLFALREGDWKLIDGHGSGGFTVPRVLTIESPAGQLYNLKTDPQETTNLHAEQNEKATAMKELLENVQRSGAKTVASNLSILAKWKDYVETPGKEGNGNHTIGPDYHIDPDLTDLGNPKGKSFEFTMALADSRIFPGTDSTLDPKKPVRTERKVFVYVPAAYQDGTKAPILVMKDGPKRLNYVSNALDNLTISKNPDHRLPAFIAISVENGGNDGKGSERGLEYDTLSDRYARFIQLEVLPAVLGNSEIKAAYPNLAFTDNPWGRGAFGCSSGGAAALTMGWFRSEWFRRIITYSGTFVDQQDDDAPQETSFPLGAWDYHSGMKLIEDSEKKPLRIFTHVSENDNRANDPEETYHNWVMANERTAAALKAKGYDYRFVYSLDARHCDVRVFEHTLADTLVWMWRGYHAE